MSGSSYCPMSAVYVHGMAPLSRIQATATEVSRPPENAMPTRSPMGQGGEDFGHASHSCTTLQVLAHWGLRRRTASSSIRPTRCPAPPTVWAMRRILLRVFAVLAVAALLFIPLLAGLVPERAVLVARPGAHHRVRRRVHRRRRRHAHRPRRRSPATSPTAATASSGTGTSRTSATSTSASSRRTSRSPGTARTSRWTCSGRRAAGSGWRRSATPR